MRCVHPRGCVLPGADAHILYTYRWVCTPMSRCTLRELMCTPVLDVRNLPFAQRRGCAQSVHDANVIVLLPTATNEGWKRPHPSDVCNRSWLCTSSLPMRASSRCVLRLMWTIFLQAGLGAKTHVYIDRMWTNHESTSGRCGQTKITHESASARCEQTG